MAEQTVTETPSERPADHRNAESRDLAPVSAGVKRFLDRFCPKPEVLLPRFGEQPSRFVQLYEGDVRIQKNSLIATRKAGDLIGEAAFYRTSNTGAADNVRGAAIVSLDTTSLFRIDRKFIADLNDHERAIWHESVARVLTAKLDEASDARDQLKSDRKDIELLVDRFVSSEGRAAARAALRGGKFCRHVDTEACHAVVWFSDVAGFSSFAAREPPDTSSQIIRSIMEIQVDAIRSANGEIDKFMGDGLMAFWRAPDAERLKIASNKAVSAALKCRDELASFFRAKSLPLDVRIGIHGGPVILGDFGVSDRIAFTLIGATVNSASRYEQSKCCIEGKPLGPVRVSPQIFNLVSDLEIRASFDAQPRQFADKHDARFTAFVSTVKKSP